MSQKRCSSPKQLRMFATYCVVLVLPNSVIVAALMGVELNLEP